MNVQWIREQLDLSNTSQRSLGKFIGMTDAQVSNILNGRRMIKAHEADQIRRFFGFEPPEERESTIAVVGKVGAGDSVFLSDAYEKGGGLYQIRRPAWIPGSNVAAAEIEGASAEPWALEGDVIFWSRQSMSVIPDDLGRPVVAELADGRVVLKRLASGSKPGAWSLLSLNPTHPNIMDTKIKWASRVLPPLSRDKVQKFMDQTS